MKLNQLKISPVKEGLNLLKVFPGHILGQTWSRPVSVNLLITSRCNSKCTTCDSWKLKDHENELTLDEFKKLAREMAEMKIPIVTIGGGEPTLRKDIWEIVRAFKNEGISVQLTTNGLTLRKEQLDRMYQSGLDRVTVSVDSHLRDVYEKIRGVDGAIQVIEHIQTILATKPRNFAIDTNTVLCADNVDTFIETLTFLTRLGLPKINFSAVTTFENNYLMVESKKNLSEIDPQKIDFIAKELLRLKKMSKAISASTTFIKGLSTYYRNPEKTVFPCYAGYLTLDIFQDGSVHGCGNLPKIANVRDGSLKDLWTSDKANQNRQDMAAGKCPNCYLSCKMELAIAGNPRHMAQFGVEKTLNNLSS